MGLGMVEMAFLTARRARVLLLTPPAPHHLSLPGENPFFGWNLAYPHLAFVSPPPVGH